MMAAILALALAAGAPPVSTVSLGEVATAIAAGRLDQAQLMLDQAAATGGQGQMLERLRADLAFAARNDSEAAARYRVLAKAAPGDSGLLERAAIAAMRVGDDTAATRLLDAATMLPAASWSAWNASGILADRRSDWEAADRAYARAEALRPGRAEVANNRGWSLLLRGEWDSAAAALDRAAGLDPASPRIANNRDFARMALADDLPRRRAGERSAQWAARLNDAGVAAQMRGETARAVAAFAQAIEAAGTWYARADANLKLAEARP